MSTPTTITTRSGTIDLLTFDRGAVRIADIAKPLSQLCRFTGHTSRFYSVAEHAVRCSWIVPIHFKMEALLHDAHEAYIGDISTPMKHAVPALASFEARVEQEVRAGFGLPLIMSEMVRRADRHMLVLEAQELLRADLGALDPEFTTSTRPEEFGWAPLYAYDKFVHRFHHLAESAALTEGE